MELSGGWNRTIVAAIPKFHIQIDGFSGSISSFISGPVIDTSGNLTFEIPTNVSGGITLTVTLEDESTGLFSIPATLTIIVNFIQWIKFPTIS